MISLEIIYQNNEWVPYQMFHQKGICKHCSWQGIGKRDHHEMDCQSAYPWTYPYPEILGHEEWIARKQMQHLCKQL
jgi:hypothetical protein